MKGKGMDKTDFCDNCEFKDTPTCKTCDVNIYKKEKDMAKEITALREENKQLTTYCADLVEKNRSLGNKIDIPDHLRYLVEKKCDELQELREEIADLRSIERDHNHTIDVLEKKHKQLKELDNYNGMLEIGMALTEKDGQIESLESKLKVYRDIIKNIKESFIKAEYPFLNAIIESRLSKISEAKSGKGGD